MVRRRAPTVRPFITARELAANLGPQNFEAVRGTAGHGYAAPRIASANPVPYVVDTAVASSAPVDPTTLNVFVAAA